jgi:creatinine amidohydrolase
MRLTIALLVTLTTALSGQTRPSLSPEKGQRLEDLTWPEAERLLTPDAIVVIPLGAASKEHGPHLKLRNDLTLAEYLTRRVADRTPVIVAPTLTYHHYPAFLEYPGSTSLSLDTARDMTSEIVRSLARYGPRRFYVVNTGMSTVRALGPSVQALAADGILVRYTELGTYLDRASRGLVEQQAGNHADEVETSMMLYIDPASVDMTKAVKDVGPQSTPPRLTRQRDGQGTYSPSGIWGDPTLASRDKGRIIVESLVTSILEDIRLLRSASLPPRSAAPQPTVKPAESTAPSRTAQELPERCSEGDERSIRGIGDAFAMHWANRDAERLASLWSRSGDMVHPDGFIERGPVVIMQNRAQLFLRREYRSTRHPMIVGVIRCLANDIAVADAKWELRDALDASGNAIPTLEGLSTLVVKRTGGAWQIEAYRYSVKPPAGPVPPTLLKRPGYPTSVK